MTSVFRHVSIAFSVLCLTILASIGFAQEPTSQGDRDGDFEWLAKPVELPPAVGLYEDLLRVPESIRRSAPFGRALNEMMRRTGKNGTFDFEARVAAFEQSKNDLMASSIAEKSAGGSQSPLSAAWTNIGLVGSASQGIFSGGCTTALAIDPLH